MSNENSVAATLVGDATNIYGAIDRDKVHGLNLTVPEDAKELIKPWDQRDDTAKFAESSVDDQIIIHVPFAEGVKIKALLLKTGRGETTPRRLQIFVNYPQIIDFSDAENTKPHIDMALLEGESGVTEYPLRKPVFSTVSSLSLFFSDSVGGDMSQIYYVGFKGELRNLQKDANEKMDIRAANAADAPIVDRLQEKSGGQSTTAR
ncbi:DUF1000-domain-containing protein [Cylindrobasidium torrendii FP15055 ss-10]|uniref:DUF1000-domain-containing protein n=1 Tax=Cylindrobasidium torrendii FP15055 ss-10 TaxID=1314674 RepID=A0A0D7AUZ7_9AGAR|nr:DUF1000-domain-containing protein [Cylindrobasidium torrendii FP15055 ss-10]